MNFFLSIAIANTRSATKTVSDIYDAYIEAIKIIAIELKERGSDIFTLSGHEAMIGDASKDIRAGLNLLFGV